DLDRGAGGRARSGRAGGAGRRGLAAPRPAALVVASREQDDRCANGEGNADDRDGEATSLHAALLLFERAPGRPGPARRTRSDGGPDSRAAFHRSLSAW